VWALEAYGAAHILQEMLTVKSDDLIGRTRAYSAIIQGSPIPESTIPETFKLLVRQLNGLGLGLDTISYDSSSIDDGEETNTVASAETPATSEDKVVLEDSV